MTRNSGYLSRPGNHLCNTPDDNPPKGRLWRCECGRLWWAGDAIWWAAWLVRPWLAWKYRKEP